jgi:hypothetical protein
MVSQWPDGSSPTYFGSAAMSPHGDADLAVHLEADGVVEDASAASSKAGATTHSTKLP